jgi:hypothetical protein
MHGIISFLRHNHYLHYTHGTVVFRMRGGGGLRNKGKNGQICLSICKLCRLYLVTTHGQYASILLNLVNVIFLTQEGS